MPITGAWNVAALSGGFVTIVMVLIVLVVVFLLVTRKEKVSGFICKYIAFVHVGSANRQLSGNEVPIAPAGPVYEEVDLAMTPRTQDIQVESNEAYGQVRK